MNLWCITVANLTDSDVVCQETWIVNPDLAEQVTELLDDHGEGKMSSLMDLEKCIEAAGNIIVGDIDGR